MFFALEGFHSPVLRSNSPGAQSVTIPSATGVLLRSEVPPHWFQSPGLITGLRRAADSPLFGDAFAGFSSAGFTPSGLPSVGVSPFGRAAGAGESDLGAGFSSAGLTPSGFPSVGVSPLGNTGFSAFSSADFSSFTSSLGIEIRGPLSVVVLPVLPTPPRRAAGRQPETSVAEMVPSSKATKMA